MSEQEKQEGQKTVVSFVSGLLIGGLLVWAFSGSPKEDTMEPTTEENTATEVAGDNTSETAAGETEAGAQKGGDMMIGNGSLTVNNQPAGSVVNLDSATFPTAEGWVAVRIYTEGQVGSILGAARFSEAQGLVPTSVDLLAPTVAGREYAVVFFSEDGNREFNLDGDLAIEGGMTTFKAE
jgi:hypothetical protein